jgi:hypothetical protein
MKYIILTIGIAAVALQGCKKCKCDMNDKVTYTNPQNAVLQYGHPIPTLDVDNDGTSDMLLNVYLYMNDGWAVEQYYVTPADHAEIAVQGEQSVMAFDKGSLITFDPGKSSIWQQGRCVLFESRTNESKNVKTGSFRNSGIKYAGIRLKKNGHYYFGWLKLSRQAGADGKDAIAIVKTAIQQEADRGIATE